MSRNGAPREDRRIGRTRAALHRALLDLTVERGYDATTVQDVLERAGIARSTFYAHFHDKDDLMLAGFKDAGDYLPGTMFVQAEADADGVPPFGLILFRHVGAQRALARAATPMLYDHMRNLVVVATRNWLQAQPQCAPAGVPQELVVQHIVGALFGLLTWWVDHDFPCSEEEIGAAAQRLLVAGLRGAATQCCEKGSTDTHE